MALNSLTDVGEEWYTETNVDGATVTVALYDDSTDTIVESDNVAAITTEPGGTSYARQSDTVTTLQIGSAFGFDNDSLISFDVSDTTTGQVDAAAIIVNFQSDTVAGDGATADNLVAVGDLSTTRQLDSVDTIEIAAGDLEITVD